MINQRSNSCGDSNHTFLIVLFFSLALHWGLSNLFCFLSWWLFTIYDKSEKQLLWRCKSHVFDIFDRLYIWVQRTDFVSNHSDCLQFVINQRNNSCGIVNHMFLTFLMGFTLGFKELILFPIKVADFVSYQSDCLQSVINQRTNSCGHAKQMFVTFLFWLALQWGLNNCDFVSLLQ